MEYLYTDVQTDPNCCELFINIPTWNIYIEVQTDPNCCELFINIPALNIYVQMYKQTQTAVIYS